MSFKKKPKRSYRDPSKLASITIRVTNEHKDYLVRRSSKYSMSLSEFIRKYHLPKVREQ